MTSSPPEPELVTGEEWGTCEPAVAPPAPPLPVPFFWTSVVGCPKLVVRSVARCRGEKTWALAAARDSKVTLQASQRPVRVSFGTGWPATGGEAGSMTVSWTGLGRMGRLALRALYCR